MGDKRKYFTFLRVGLIGIFLVGTFGSTLFSINWGLKRVITRYSPEIEKKLSEILKRPVLLGPYRGITSWGIVLGNSKLLSGYEDDSSADFSSVKVQFAPISTFLDRRFTGVVTLSGSDIKLQRDKNGKIWGGNKTNGENGSQNFGLKLKIDKSSTISFSSESNLARISGYLDIKFFDNSLNGTLKFAFPKQGTVNLKGKANWDRVHFEAKAKLGRFRLDALEKLYPIDSKLETKGILNGDIKVGVNDENINCSGNIALADLNVSSKRLDSNFISKKTNISCKDNLLEFSSNKIIYGNWIGKTKGGIPLGENDSLNVAMSTNIRHSNNKNTEINIDAVLPFIINNGSFLPGELNSNFDVESYSLNSIGLLIDQKLAGKFSARGNISGELNSLKPSFLFTLENPQFSNIRLQEKWLGQFMGVSGGGGEFDLRADGAALPASMKGELAKNWSLKELTINRLGGEIKVKKNADKFNFVANDFRLDRLEIAIPPEKSFKRLFGKLSGKGNVRLNPVLLDGELNLGYPRLLGLKLKKAQFSGNYVNQKYSLKGDLFPLDSGQISVDAAGTLYGELSSQTKLKDISPSWLIQSALQLPKMNVELPLPTGKADELGSLSIKTIKSSIESQLNQWVRSVVYLSKNQEFTQQKEFINPEDVKGNIDAVIDINGSKLSELNIDLLAKGKLWPANENVKLNQIKPFTASLRGPLQFGPGEFSLSNIPLSLLSLFVPSPSGLSGMFGVNGKYRLGKNDPEVTGDLIFNEVALNNERIYLKKGEFFYSNYFLNVNLAIQSSLSTNELTLVGQIPFKSNLPIDLRIESHGDGISFIENLYEDIFTWKKGSADLRLLITGTIESPQANGFLVVKNGEILTKGQLIKNLESLIVFDFNRVEFLSLSAKLGDQGTIKGDGSIALFSKNNAEKDPLSIEITDLQLKSSFSETKISSSLFLDGSLLKPIIGGSVDIKEGSIFTKRQSQKKSASFQANNQLEGSSRQTSILPEQKWNREEPLVLFIRDNDATATKLVNSAIPKGFSPIKFNNLRLNLGPELKVSSQPIASFNIAGFLILNGGQDQPINASGLIRLLKGRVNLFTTTFLLDRREPNVAVFVPSMGLIPYIDVKLTSRVPDTVRDPSDLSSSSDFVTNGSGSFGIGGSRFVKVDVIATGPADRIKDNYQLKSTPPIPENELLGLIGGNSLANLFKGGDGRVFADVINRSFVSPVLGNISGSFSEKLQISLYPAYVNSTAVEGELVDEESATNSENNPGQLTSQQAWVTEMGIDLTDRITFSVQATPSREDIPPQGNLNLQLNKNFGLQGSFDQNGNWQSQLEIFIRY